MSSWSITGKPPSSGSSIVAPQDGETETGSGVNVKHSGTAIDNNPHRTLNFTGSVTLSDDGDGQATIDVVGGSDGVNLEEGSDPIAGNPHATLNFAGAGVAVADDGGGVATITIAGGITGITIEDAGTPISGNPHTTLNFTGAGVTATDSGSGVSQIAIPGGVAISGTPNTLAKFNGAGTNVENSGVTDDGSTVTVVGENLVSQGSIHADGAIVSDIAISAGTVLQWGGGSGPILFSGTGSPNGVVTAAVGCLYVDTSTGTYYAKTSGAGNTGWVALASGNTGGQAGSIGNGSDGAVHFDGVATVLGIAPTTVSGIPGAAVYRMVRDIFPTSLIVDSGVVLWAQNYRVFVRGTATINGALHNNGKGTLNGFTGSTSSGSLASENGSGGAGAAGAGFGSSGSASGSAPADAALTSDGGGALSAGTVPLQGGAGGASAGHHGGDTSPVTVATSNAGGISLIQAQQSQVIGTSSIQLSCGAGGGGGGADGGSSGGSGGAGGCWGFFAFGQLGGSGTVSCDGGAGCPAQPVGGVDQCGGGGGGGGGVCCVAYDTLLTPAPTITANGGVGGAGGNGGTVGFAGAAGIVRIFTA